MDTNNKYTGFEKMMQDKLGNHEYPYDHNDWLNFEKKLPKGKGHLKIPRNIFRYIIIPAAVIIPTVLILYFTNAFNTNDTKDKPNTNDSYITSNNNTNTENISNNDKNNSSDNQKNVSINNDNSNTYNSSADNNDNTDVLSNDKSTNQQNDNNSNNTADNSNSIKDNTNSNNDKALTGGITSDVVEGCAPLKVKFTPWVSSSSISYTWDFGDGKKAYVAEPSHIYSKAGSYTVTLNISSTDGKTKKKIEYAQKIEVKGTPKASYTYTVDSETDEYSFKDNSTDAFIWTWSFGDISSSNEKDPAHTFTQDGSYNVKLTVMNTAGCSDTISKKIAVKLKELYYCPTGFTPNNDGLNDYFGPIGERMNAEGYKMQIYDKNGLMVFETTDLNVLWDGINQKTNAEAAQGMYFWKISMKDKNNNLKESTGYLTLIR